MIHIIQMLNDEDNPTDKDVEDLAKVINFLDSNNIDYEIDPITMIKSFNKAFENMKGKKF